MLWRRKIGQSTAEYAIVIGLVIAAAVAMQVYVKRGLQGKIKGAADYNDPKATMLTGKPFEPDYASSSMTLSRNVKNVVDVNREQKEGEVVRTFGVTTREKVAADIIKKSGTQTQAALGAAEGKRE